MDGRKQEILKSDLKNSKYFNKRVVYFILLVILFSVLVCFVPMIFDNNSNDVSLVGVTDNILLNNNLPLTDISGKTLDASNVRKEFLNEVAFSIKGIGNEEKAVRYEICLINEATGKEINSNYVKIYLTDNDNKPFNFYNGNAVPVYQSLRISEGSADGKVIYSDIIKGKEIKKFKLRVWLSDAYILNETDRYFSAKIVVRKVSQEVVMESKKGVSKKVFSLILLISIFIILILILAFGIFFKKQEERDDKNHNPGSIVLNYTDSTIFKVTNLKPMTDDLGMKSDTKGSYYDFVVDTKLDDSKEVDYEVAVTLIDDETNVDLNNIKVYLEKEDSGSYISVFGPDKFKKITKKSKLGTPADSMIVFNTTKSSDANENYRLRVWMDEKATANENTTYTISLNVDVYGSAKQRFERECTMDNTLSRQILLAVLGLALLVLAIVGVSYAITIPNKSLNKVYLVSDDNSAISLNNLPMSDYEGINLNGSSNVFDFCVKGNIADNASIDYVIALEKIDSDYDSLDDKDVKVYLEKYNLKEFVSTDITSVPIAFTRNNIVSDISTPDGSMILYYGGLQNATTDKKEVNECFRLRLWIDEDSIIESSKKEFMARVNVYSKVL